MPFIQLSSPYSFSPFAQRESDPFVDFLAAALAADSAPSSHCASKQTCAKPAQPASTSQPAAAAAAQKQAAAAAQAAHAEKVAACQRACAVRRQQRQPKRWITPNFDISEYKNEYILEGELPGVSDKSSISVDFEDAQTIVIRGEVKRAVRQQAKTEQSQPLTEEALQASAAASEKAAAASEQGETVVYEQEKKQRPPSVTVEEVEDESETASNASFEVVEGPVLDLAENVKGKGKAKEDVEMTEATAPVAAEKPAQPITTAAAAPKKAEKPAARYWISERPIGVFERKFRFNNLIDQDNVRASLENGLLTIVVPKRDNYVRQVFIF